MKLISPASSPVPTRQVNYPYILKNSQTCIHIQIYTSVHVCVCSSLTHLITHLCLRGHLWPPITYSLGSCYTYYLQCAFSFSRSRYMASLFLSFYPILHIMGCTIIYSVIPGGALKFLNKFCHYEHDSNERFKCYHVVVLRFFFLQAIFPAVEQLYAKVCVSNLLIS